MANLTPEQKEQVSAWVAEGLGLSDIQKRLKAELDLNLTFMDVRFLVSDLALQVNSPTKEEQEEQLPADAPLDALDDQETTGVTLEKDSVIRPGYAASGTVKFSDGKTAKWFIDPMGQLGLEPPEPGYQPPGEDVEEFQIQLRSLLQGPAF
jgi:hypothetical protein